MSLYGLLVAPNIEFEVCNTVGRFGHSFSISYKAITKCIESINEHWFAVQTGSTKHGFEYAAWSGYQ